MWKKKKLKSETEARQFIANHKHKYQMNLIFINNGCVVEYKKLRVI